MIAYLNDMTQPSFPVMSALAQVSRWRIFQLLMEVGEDGLLQGEIATALGVSKNLLSVHLKIMQAAGLVTAERNGREVTYRATPEPVRATARILVDATKGPRRTIRRR